MVYKGAISSHAVYTLIAPAAATTTDTMIDDRPKRFFDSKILLSHQLQVTNHFRPYEGINLIEHAHGDQGS